MISAVKKIFTRIFSTQYMVKENLKRGEITPSNEAYRVSFKIALPAVADMVSVNLIGILSMLMVGRLGPFAVAAVGLTQQPRMIFMAIFFALNIGVTAIVSRRKGEEDQESARLCMRQTIMIGVILSVIMSVVAFFSAEFMMDFAGANEDTLLASTQYFQILVAGLIFQALSITICAAQRGVGNTKITMYVNMGAITATVILNFLLIEGRWIFPRLEMHGAAIAVIIGNAVGFLMALHSIMKKDSYLRISIKDKWLPDRAMLKSLFRITGGSMIEQVAVRVGFLAYAIIIANLGTEALAAHHIAMQLFTVSFAFADGVGAATTALVGQNLGKGRPDLSIMYGTIGQRLAMIIAILLMIISLLGNTFFPSLFTDDQNVIAATSTIVIILAFLQPLQMSQIVMAGSLRGAGDVKYVAFTMLLTVSLIRPLLSALFAYTFGLGLPGAWLALIADQIMRLVMLYTRFARGKWIHIRV